MCYSSHCCLHAPALTLLPSLIAYAGALVGVSLCDAEASIAAPMTSRIPNIGVMATVVAEGRCAMVTTLIIFKYIMCYAFIQVGTVFPQLC